MDRNLFSVNSGCSVGNLPTMDLEPYRAFMLELARASGDFIVPLYGEAGLAVDRKADQTPVTAADRGAEELMRGLIARKFPGHGIIGEEFGEDRSDAEFVWVLDPVDGTKSFISGVPLWGTLIALLHQGNPVLGCIHQPVLGQLAIGDGKSTQLNGKPVRCRPTKQLEEATVLATSLRRRALPGIEELFDRARLARSWGDCYGYLLVATGRADLMIDPELKLWDLAALVPIIQGAGGVITDCQGGPAYPAASALAAATPELHAAALAVLAG